MDSRNKMLNMLLDIGEELLKNGAEVKRVEDTLERMGRAYGAVRMNVFAITSSITVTMAFADDQEVTQMRRIVNSGATDFSRVEDLNGLSRSFCEGTLAAEELQRMIGDEKKKGLSRKRLYLGSIVTAAGMCVFFGGSLADGAAAAAFALLICIMQEKLQPFCANQMIFNLICAFLTGLSIAVLARLVPFLHGDQIMIGDIMLLIPGIAMTNSIKDIMVGDTISGIMRLTESLLWASALACGFMAAVWIVGI